MSSVTIQSICNELNAFYALRMGFGERLKEARNAKQLSGAELGKRVAARIGQPEAISRQTVSHWEKDRHPPALPELIAICEELGVSMDRLAFGVSQTLSLEALKIATLAEALSQPARRDLIHRLTVPNTGPRNFPGDPQGSEEGLWNARSTRQGRPATGRKK